MRKGTLRQILLITDGCSNHGEDPVAIAALAKEKGITVNVIGILSRNEAYGEHGLKEVEDIAMSGGGISQIVYANQLAQTVKMVTQKAMTQTIHGMINKELTHILGEGQQMEDLPPEKRGQVMEVVDEFGEMVDLEVLILVDISASMDDKLPTVQESLIDLSISLNSRTGNNLFAIYAFPGKRQPIDRLIDWDPQLDSLVKTFKKISTGGITPTGPALREALELFSEKRSKQELLGGDDEYIEESGS
ncbi:VWA domain-containing protein [Pseudalkalibacillus decolorationis]|uniref:VWA domain-containing protein n=1 Tax=Pseudalkalibacillus decolorationis TaxID=163879 RepID=UPI002148EE82|nr:VWA domain-containing protein [Pseudalkalibacillus decolorationis]